MLRKDAVGIQHCVAKRCLHVRSLRLVAARCRCRHYFDNNRRSVIGAKHIVKPVIQPRAVPQRDFRPYANGIAGVEPGKLQDTIPKRMLPYRGTRGTERQQTAWADSPVRLGDADGTHSARDVTVPARSNGRVKERRKRLAFRGPSHHVPIPAAIAELAIHMRTLGLSEPTDVRPARREGCAE